VLTAKVLAKKVAVLRQRPCTNAEEQSFIKLQVSMITTVVGSYSADQLRTIAGPNIPNQ
jgi:hypothetical protein